MELLWIAQYVFGVWFAREMLIKDKIYAKEFMMMAFIPIANITVGLCILTTMDSGPMNKFADIFYRRKRENNEKNN
jgi:hypothetical protein